jgi:hypothetical protein
MPNQFQDNFANLDGVHVKLKGQGFICPALNFKGLRQLKGELATIQTGWDMAGDVAKTDAYIAAVTKVVHAALSRNYPTITIEFVEDAVDLKNVAEVTLAVMGVTGYTQEAAAAPGAPAGEPTGTP